MFLEFFSTSPCSLCTCLTLLSQLFYTGDLTKVSYPRVGERWLEQHYYEPGRDLKVYWDQWFDYQGNSGSSHEF